MVLVGTFMVFGARTDLAANGYNFSATRLLHLRQFCKNPGLDPAVLSTVKLVPIFVSVSRPGQRLRMRRHGLGGRKYVTIV